MSRYGPIPLASTPQVGSKPVKRSEMEGEWRERIHTALRDTFGFSSFRGEQEKAIIAALSGKDCFVLMPTGGGKSLCYSLPALVLDKRLVLVVSPLIALMQDQVSALQRRGVAAAYLSSAQTAAEQRAILTCLADNLNMANITAQDLDLPELETSSSEPTTLRLLFVTPERLVSSDFRETLKAMHKKQQLGLLAVDEAHCVSSWGHDFRPKYRQICFVRHDLPGLPVMALTATASGKVREDVMQQLRLVKPVVLLASFNRPNIMYSVTLLDTMVGRAAKAAGATALVQDVEEELLGASGGGGVDATAVPAMNELGRLLAKHVRAPEGVCGCAIVYVHRRVDADDVVARVQRVPGGAGLRCAAYHGGMKDDERKHVLDQWMAGELDLVAATVAFGMGIDRADVRLVVHWCLAQSLEGYYQESGRAGRDGKPAHATLFYRNADRSRIEWVLSKDLAAKEAKAKSKSQTTKSKGSKGSKADQEAQARAQAQKGGIIGGAIDLTGSTPGQAASSATDIIAQSAAQRGFAQAVAYATTPGCRRQALLAHFDERLPLGGCQGCDYCQDPQGVKAAVASLSTVGLGTTTRQGPSGLSVEARASNNWRAKAPAGTYGMDDVQEDDDSDDDGGSEGGGRYKRNRSDDDSEGDESGMKAARGAAVSCLFSDPAGMKAARTAAEASRGKSGGGGVTDTVAYLDDMARKEAAHDRNTTGDSVLDRLLQSKAQGGGAAHKTPPGQVVIPEAKRKLVLDKLQSSLEVNCCAGLPTALIEAICRSIEEGLADTCTTASMYHPRATAQLSGSKSNASVFQMLSHAAISQSPATQDQEEGQGPALDLQTLLAAELQAIHTLADEATDSASEEKVALRLKHLADVKVTTEMLHVIGRSAGHLRKHKAPAVAAAAKTVVETWRPSSA